MALRYLGKCLHITGPTPNVDPDNARGARRDQPLHLTRIYVVCTRIHIAEHRLDLLPLQGMGRGDEGEGRDNHFTREAESPSSNLQSYRRIAHGDAVLDPQQISDALFKLLDVWSVVREPPPVQDVIEQFEKALPVADVGPADMQRIPENRLAAKYCQVI
jgi:hypothetical protein